MSGITLKERQAINHELKRVGFGGLEDRNLFAQIATLYKTHEAFRGLLLSTAPSERRIAYESLRPHLCFVAKPLDVYEREIRDKAEREQWDVYDGTAFPKPFQRQEIETESYKLERQAQEAIEDARHEKAGGQLEMVCTKCTVAEYFPAAKRKEAVKKAHDAGWRWDERNGTRRQYCPKHVPGRCTMTIECQELVDENTNLPNPDPRFSQTSKLCGRKLRLRVWDEQDGYREARLLGWEIGDVAKCPRCAAKLVIVQ